MTPLHLAALNGNDNILEMIGKNNLNSRDYRSRKADQLLGRFFTCVGCNNLRVKSNASQNDTKLLMRVLSSVDDGKKLLIAEVQTGNFISF